MTSRPWSRRRSKSNSAFDAREALRSLARLGDRRRTALTLEVAGHSYREIQQLLGVAYTWINRHVTEGRAELRRRARLAEAAVEARCGREVAPVARPNQALGPLADRLRGWGPLDDPTESARRG